MKSVARLGTPLLAAALLWTVLAQGCGHAAQMQPPADQYAPSVGQEGKDVIWVPTPQALVERMLAMAEVKPTDYVMDLGSGDGRTVITAAKKFGARALGIEYNPDMVELSKRNAEKEGVADRAQFRRADIFATDLSDATVITMYLLPSLNVKLRPTLLNLKPGTRLVSHAFTMGDWQPDYTENSEGRTAYLWIVPARIEGRWRLDLAGATPTRYDIQLRQRFQNLEGEASAGNGVVQIRNGKVRGDEVTFTISGGGSATRVFTGRLSGERLEGSSNGASAAKWTGTRID